MNKNRVTAVTAIITLTALLTLAGCVGTPREEILASL
jgi:hypothetical protein